MDVGKSDKKDVKTARLNEELMYVGMRYDNLSGDVFVREIKFRAPTGDGAEWMCTVKAWVGEAQMVGFVSAPDLDVLVHWVCAKLMNGGMKWREDKPYGN